MKKIILFAFCTIILLAGCTKKGIVDNSEQVGISRITYYAILTFKGSDYMAVPKGSTYTEPGCTAKSGTADLPVVITGTVNTSVAGVYALTYTATNKDGFKASVQRFVAVYSTDASATANDLSGSYLRPAKGFISTWSKIAPGVYKVVDPGGANSNLTVIAFNSTGLSIKIPSQVSSDGTITSSTAETYNNLAPAQYSWIIQNPTYGTSSRSFVKQ